MKKPVNIRTLAELCGTSASTASRIMNYPPEKAGAGRELYDRVTRKAAEIGYRPNYLAQAMFTKKTNFIGFISGHTMPLAFGSLLEGLTSVLTPNGKGVFIYPCRNQTVNELAAIDRMIYQKMDAIAYYPSLFPEGKCDSRALADKLNQYPDHPPLLAILGGTDLPQACQVRLKDQEFGRQAALRHLELGCRTFGILNTNYASLRSLDTMTSYRETLQECGVKPDKITTVHVPLPLSAENLAPLKGIDGLWCSYLQMLPNCLYHLEKVCDVSNLHVDTFASMETTDMFRWLLPAVFSTESRRTHPFKSMHLSLISLYDIGMKSAEIILRELEAPAKQPYTEYADHTYCSFDEQMDILLAAQRSRNSDGSFDRDVSPGAQ